MYSHLEYKWSWVIRNKETGEVYVHPHKMTRFTAKILVDIWYHLELVGLINYSCELFTVTRYGENND